jgi:hypothetical protein
MFVSVPCIINLHHNNQAPVAPNRGTSLRLKKKGDTALRFAECMHHNRCHTLQD